MAYPEGLSERVRPVLAAAADAHGMAEAIAMSMHIELDKLAATQKAVKKYTAEGLAQKAQAIREKHAEQMVPLAQQAVEWQQAVIPKVVKLFDGETKLQAALAPGKYADTQARLLALTEESLTYQRLQHASDSDAQGMLAAALANQDARSAALLRAPLSNRAWQDKNVAASVKSTLMRLPETVESWDQTTAANLAALERVGIHSEAILGHAEQVRNPSAPKPMMLSVATNKLRAWYGEHDPAGMPASLQKPGSAAPAPAAPQAA